MKYTKLSRKEFEELLFNKFSDLYSERSLPPSQSCMCWGIDVQPGWFDLIWKLSSDIAKADKKSKHKVSVMQVKEKFGGLRYYFSGGNTKIEKLVSKAEALSEKTCERCGKVYKKKFTKIHRGWVHTICDKCWEPYKKEMNIK